MIDRSQFHFCLRGKTLLLALLVSVGLFLFLPIAAGLLLLLGGLGFLVCWLAVGVMALLSYGCLIAGGLAVLGGVGNLKENPNEAGPLLGGGVLALAVGGLCHWLFEGRFAPVMAGADITLAACRAGSYHLFVPLWIGWWVFAWSWVVVAAALLQAVLVLLAIGLLRLESSCKYTLFKIGYTCPACHRRAVPLFRCPGCAKLVPDLAPSVYGVWTVRCKCGERLRTTDLGGRLRRYEKVCRNPVCQRDLADKVLGESPEFHLAVVGAVSSGKSVLMVTAVWQLETVFAPRNELAVQLVNATEEQVYRQSIALLREGKLLPKTVSGPAPRAFNVALRSPSRTALLYLYDAAGEDFEAGDLQLASHQFHGYVDGVLFVIDPFAEADLRRGVSGEQASKSKPATTDAADILGRLIPFWEVLLRVPPSHRLPIPVAVVVSKSDACGLEERLGQVPGLDRTYDRLAAAAEEAESHSETVRRYLVEGGLGNLMRTLQTRFARVACFGVSALGRVPDPADRSPFRPRGVLAPLVWLAYHSRALHDTAGLWQMGRNLALYLPRSLRGSEGALAKLAVWGLLLAGVVTAFAGLAWWLGFAWGLGLVGTVLAAWAVAARYRACGLHDLHALRHDLGRLRQRLTQALHGEAGRPKRVLAWSGLGGALLGIGVLGWWWWPAGLTAGLVLLAAFLASLGEW